MNERYANNNGIKIHYLDNAVKSRHIPLVYVPGMLGRAENFIDEFPLFSERRVISISLRGRGKSDAAKRGYTLSAHATDIAAVIKDTKLSSFVLLAYSAGVAYSLSYAIQHPELLSGIILLDFPAQYRKYSEKWVERVRGHIPEDKMYVAKALSQESENVPLWDNLNKLKCPTSLIYGGKSQFIDATQLEQYQTALPDINIICFEESGHELWQPDYDHFIQVIQEQIIQMDKE